MERKEVSSSSIKSIGHDPATNTMEVEFHSGKVYTYSNVPAEKHAEFISAKSIGGHFAKHICRQHDYKVSK